jgi:hypothetical protein
VVMFPPTSGCQHSANNGGRVTRGKKTCDNVTRLPAGNFERTLWILPGPFVLNLVETL